MDDETWNEQNGAPFHPVPPYYSSTSSFMHAICEGTKESQGTFTYCTCYQKQSVEVEQWHIHYQAWSMHGNLPQLSLKKKMT